MEHDYIPIKTIYLLNQFFTEEIEDARAGSSRRCSARAVGQILGGHIEPLPSV